MKRVTAREAQKHWFRLLDEVAGGATVVIERHGIRMLLTRASGADADVPDYGDILRVPDGEEADRWGWRWEGEEG